MPEQSARCGYRLSPMVQAVALALACLSPKTLYPRETYTSWKRSDVIEYSIRFIDSTKKEFKKRAEALQAFDGTVVALDYEYFDPMGPEEEANHLRFLQGRIGDAGTSAHISGFLKDLERVRVKLAEAEAIAFPKWEQMHGAQERTPERVDAELYGTSVSSSNLGVILDSSPSMESYLEPLRKEIAERFPNTHFAETDGCYLDQPGENPWFYATPGAHENPFDPGWYCGSIPETGIHWLVRSCEVDTTSAIRAMVEIHKVDAIYWFADFEDKFDESVMRSIGRLILENEVKLYLHTPRRRPPQLLRELVDRSGGELVRERLR